MDLLRAISDAGAKEILELAKGDLDTYITKGFDENGIELSGGQHHKLAIARTFYRDTNFIILDEPSAALDPEAEHTLFKNQKNL